MTSEQRARIEAARSSIAALRDAAREYGQMPCKVRDMHVSLLHRQLDALAQALSAHDALQAQLAEFAEFCKDGETPIERMRRERADTLALMGMLAEARAEVERLTKSLELQKGANYAQDERERLAADRLAMSHSCDWPDDVAEQVLGLRAEVERLKGELRERSFRAESMERRDGDTSEQA